MNFNSPKECGYYGHASTDDGGLRRQYSRSECDKMGGTFHAGGDCSPYTNMCSELNLNPLAMLYENRYIIGGLVILGGGGYWYYRKKFTG
jgi:hypothetical protein